MQILWGDSERVFCRVLRTGANGDRSILLSMPATQQPLPASLARLANEFALKEELNSSWAVQPLEMLREDGQMHLVLEDPGGQPLLHLLATPMGITTFLQHAISIARALGKLHQRGLVHKDIKPGHILVNCSDGQARITGFGLAVRVARERLVPEKIVGTLAYMSPEQTGRMNSSIDSRSDLYSFGVTLYQMLTATLPFTAVDPIEWVHCHIAKKPVPASSKVPSIPKVLCDIVSKLLAKTAEERYQSAVGVEIDLRRCLDEWQQAGQIKPFTLCQHDASDRLLIPEKLYGRQRQVETLVTAFNRIITSSATELVLVTGYSGIGKSSVVNELHKVLVPTRGIFASGKFDQYSRDIPYSTLVQAFRSLVRNLLGKNDRELAAWRDALQHALQPDARLMTNLIPELKLIIGETPPVPTLDPQQAQCRFLLVLHRFIGVFAQEDHPLVLFLDNLQWLDAATLDLLEKLLTSLHTPHLMLIGAYRSNEVDAGHPLSEKIQAIREAGGRVVEVNLEPFTKNHIEQLIAETLDDQVDRVVPLAQLVLDKTAGNPFFVIQFLQTLVDEQLLTFDHHLSRWFWDPDRIHTKGYTDNIVDLLVDKLARLPADTLHALQHLACLGNVADVQMLATAMEVPKEQLLTVMWEATRQGIIERLEDGYGFVHDRIQEAAYSLIPKDSRAQAHLRIGRLLSAQSPAQDVEEAIFEIVGQLNRGIDLITEQDEREQLAEYNLMAGQRAKASSAYVSALNYLTTGAQLLDNDCWTRRKELSFALELNRAECEFLTGELLVADKRLTALAKHATTVIDRADVARLHMDVYLLLDRSDASVAVCLDYLRHVGIEWSPHPSDDEVRQEYDRIWPLLGDWKIEELVDLPMMEDIPSLIAVNILAKLFPPALQTDENLTCLSICRAVCLSLERGNSDASCVHYANVFRVAGRRFGDYQAGYRFGQLGCKLVEQRGFTRFEPSTFLCFSNFTVRWMSPVAHCRDLLRRSFSVANRVGDLPYGAYAGNSLISDALFAGEQLCDVQREAERGLAYAVKVKFGLVTNLIETQFALIRMLRGKTSSLGCFDDQLFNERTTEAYLSSSPDLALAECWYWVRKIQAYYIAGNYPAAMEASAQAERLLWTSNSFFEEAEFYFYHALVRAAWCDCVPEREHALHLVVMEAAFRQLQMWAQQCPENFASRATLVGAEIARVEGRVMDAELLYEQATSLAQHNGFTQIEALANELASRFYAQRGLSKISQVYLQDARYCYLRWGADGKVLQLDTQYPSLRTDEHTFGPTTTMATAVEHLDLATVLKVSQAVSSEIVLDKFIDKLMFTAIEQAGAERGLLILSDVGEPRIAAQVTSGHDVTELRDAPVSAEQLPESVLYHVLRTRESIVLTNAAAEAPFAADYYICENRARSILCLPLVIQAKLIGALYLENNLMAGVFSRDRIAVLKLVASQAAISLENARLYREVAERESKIRRLLDANIIGIVVWKSDGDIVEANDAFLDMLHYTREDFALSRLHWRDLTVPQYFDISERSIEEAARSGRAQPFEKEYFKRDGSTLPAIVCLARLDADMREGVAFVLDRTELNQAEEKIRESERRYREVQTELSHANRVATMGEMVASIAHEVNQPIAAAVLNANAAQRWLSIQPLNLDEVRQVLAHLIQNANRAADVLGRIRSHIRKAPPQKGPVDINEAIGEMVEFSRGEITKAGASVQIQLTDNLQLVVGDRVELQQVLLNLIMNALEAMDATPKGERHLHISAVPGDKGYLLVSVSDSGHGFDTDNPDQVFASFYTTKATGLGMGLSICQSIIEAHGGRLRASANQPRGATFQFTLPVVKQ
ncbi:AAA family ATPase [Pseudomonas sp. KK4]|uniref:trifunctional serine/threonine-protein kinase/ATP-binding protein/sensor histidine kinase n=1 Tax=Pseudomonas sp. KK4 TaxID=1855729 RepID=UPI00097BD908|nr:AAA family ATPase [Pseudomonas sp. KK4]